MYKASRLMAGLFAAVLATTCLRADCDEKAGDYDWTVTLQTQVLKGEFNYQNSTLKDPVEVQVSYLQRGQTQSVLYERFWYANGKPLGQEKLAALNITQGQQLDIEITHKTSPDSNLDQEDKAAANATLRTLVNLYMNSNMVTAVKVPMESFSDMQNDLQNYGFSAITVDPDQPSPSKLTIFLESDQQTIPVPSVTLAYDA
jgi:hypothetical protein